jgi:hypothetical protein
MKLLTISKITLIVPDKRARRDNTFTPDNDDIPEGEKKIWVKDYPKYYQENRSLAERVRQFKNRGQF